METMGIDTGKLNLIRLIMDINNNATIEKIRSYIQGLSVVAPDETKKTRLTSYEQARKDIREGKVNTYNSLDDFYQKMGI